MRKKSLLCIVCEAYYFLKSHLMWTILILVLFRHLVVHTVLLLNSHYIEFTDHSLYTPEYTVMKLESWHLCPSTVMFLIESGWTVALWSSNRCSLAIFWHFNDRKCDDENQWGSKNLSVAFYLLLSETSVIMKITKSTSTSSSKYDCMPKCYKPLLTAEK